MNILRLVTAEKEKKNRPPSQDYKKAEEQASCRDKGDCPIKYPKDDLKKRLTPVEYHVTQDRGTERAYSGKYLRHKEEGVFSCAVCDNPLFSSDQKFDSGCGWPSFHDVIAQGKVSVHKDTTHCLQRIEIRCSQCGSHLGHLFDDGPKDKRLRYCVNSCSLDFKKHTTV